MNKTGISVIICTYNGEKQLPATLQHLFAQQGLEKIDWEIIIVDNNSTDNTNAFVQDIINQNNNFNIKLLFQPAEGKLEALRLALVHAGYQYLIITDDDNWLNNNYLATAYLFMETHPQIGILGGKGAPVNVELLPKWIIPHLHNYAAAEQWNKSADITHTIGSVYGAGMTIRKEIYDITLKQNWPLYLSAKRKGKILLSGEDTEICYIARFLGYHIYYYDELSFQHNFPPSKINQDYLLNLVYYFGYGAAMLLPYTELESNKRNSIVKTLVAEIYRLLRYNLNSLIGQSDLEQRKKLYYRYGFIKGLFINHRQIKNLRLYLKKRLKSAGSSYHS